MHVYHGDGKGKTTAAMGLALRALGAGARVAIVQFLKAGTSGEVVMLDDMPCAFVLADPACAKFAWEMTDAERERVRALHDQLLSEALRLIDEDYADMLVLDEVLDALSSGLVDAALVERALAVGARDAEVVLTGHALTPEIREAADYLTEMRCEKHPFNQGVPARKGIEY